MPFSQNIFQIRTASEGMVDIYRQGTHQRLCADQDMETRVLRSAMLYIEQQKIIPSLLADDRIQSFIHEYVPGYRLISLSRNLPPFPTEGIPALGTPLSSYDTRYLTIQLPGGAEYYPRIKDETLIFTYEGTMLEESLMVTPRDADDLIIALFDATRTGAIIRATARNLAIAMDHEYLKIRSRRRVRLPSL